MKVTISVVCYKSGTQSINKMVEQHQEDSVPLLFCSNKFKKNPKEVNNL